MTARPGRAYDTARRRATAERDPAAEAGAIAEALGYRRSLLRDGGEVIGASFWPSRNRVGSVVVPLDGPEWVALLALGLRVQAQAARIAGLEARLGAPWPPAEASDPFEDGLGGEPGRG